MSLGLTWRGSLIPKFKPWPEFAAETPLLAANHRVLPMLKAAEYRKAFQKAIDTPALLKLNLLQGGSTSVC